MYHDFSNHNKTNLYLDEILSNGFIPLITKPTRISVTSATLIDHLYSNSITSIGKSGIIITDVADHFGTFFISNGQRQRQKIVKRQKRSFSQNNINKFKEALKQINFSHISRIDCPNRAYNEFIIIYLKLFEESFPLHDYNLGSNFVKREPWFTNGLLVFSKRKSEMFKKKLIDPSPVNINRYKLFNNIFNLLKRNMKTLYFKTALEEYKHDSKKCWTLLKQAIGKLNDKSSYPQTFNINNNPVTDKRDIFFSYWSPNKS